MNSKFWCLNDLQQIGKFQHIGVINLKLEIMMVGEKPKSEESMLEFSRYRLL